MPASVPLVRHAGLVGHAHGRAGAHRGAGGDPPRGSGRVADTDSAYGLPKVRTKFKIKSTKKKKDKED